MQASLTSLMRGRLHRTCRKMQKWVFVTLRSSEVGMWLSVVVYSHMQSVTEEDTSGLGVVLNDEFNLLNILTPSPSLPPKQRKIYYYPFLPVKLFLDLALKTQKITSVQLYTLLILVLEILSFLFVWKIHMCLYTYIATEKRYCLANKSILSMENLSQSQFSTGSYNGTFF